MACLCPCTRETRPPSAFLPSNHQRRSTSLDHFFIRDLDSTRASHGCRQHCLDRIARTGRDWECPSPAQRSTILRFGASSLHTARSDRARRSVVNVDILDKRRSNAGPLWELLEASGSLTPGRDAASHRCMDSIETTDLASRMPSMLFKISFGRF